MAPPKRRPPDLDHCVEVLLRLQNNQLIQSPKSIGEVYVCCLGLLYHLKVDKKTIAENRHKTATEELELPYPKLSSVPAISVVVHHQGLLRALITCLSTTQTEMEASADSHRGGGNGNQPVNSRKRTSSMDGVSGVADNHNHNPPTKTMKLSHSPHASSKKAPSALFPRPRPAMNIKVVAATILYTAFEHLDHWPAAFVKAYAEDSFGPRTWVDESACQVFVENLKLTHSMKEEGDNDDGDELMEDTEGTKDADAITVAEFYKSFNQTKGGISAQANSPAVQRRGSLSSNSSDKSAPIPQGTRPRSFSTDSNSNVSVYSEKSNSVSRNLPVTQKAKNTIDSDSDSGEEEEVVTLTRSLLSHKEDGDSSSSGEDDEEVVLSSAKSFRDENGSIPRTSPFSEANDKPPQLKPSYPIQQRYIHFKKVRQRYFGENLERAHQNIADSLQQRLDAKAKQNSGLLQTLPQFVGVPSVRRVITANLEKWLQSPALAGLARSLFSITVQSMKAIDPPLLADLDAIENILAMRLKANQLNAHIENINSIAKSIPTAAVANHIYKFLIREYLMDVCGIEVMSTNHRKMIQAIYNSYPMSLNAKGLSCALMSLLLDRPHNLEQLPRPTYMRHVLSLVRSLYEAIGDSFCGFEMLEEIAIFGIPEKTSWSKPHEEDRARLMFQCALFSITDPIGMHKRLLGTRESTVDDSTMEKNLLKKNLRHARLIFLNWFCNNFAGFCTSDNQTPNHTDKKESEIHGAGPPDYTSVLDGINNKDFPAWVALVRALLFMEGPESKRLQSFLFFNEPATLKEEEVSAILLCNEFGATVDNEIVGTILDAATSHTKKSPNAVALTIIEHLFHGCTKGKIDSLTVDDPTLILQLYTLVEYTYPSKYPTEGCNDVAMAADDSEIKKGNSSTRELTRLAHPGMWWRVTVLALVMCGASPKIGSIAWLQYPTLQVLIKMVTSDRYRFPTVDCNDSKREEMKQCEQHMRDDEAKMTELLFLPRPKVKAKVATKEDTVKSAGGPRVSKRQLEKREKALKKAREREARELQKEGTRRKKMLRVAQKSIMLWDPKKGARKPPKESADLIFAVGESFHLAETFQRATEPDYLLKTIGDTTRGGIERAYNWLIPIISVVPETITRLPASASCFLLLRAYGTEGEERVQLQKLSAPLLAHVRESLGGAFGEADAVRAFDLLLTDVASHNTDRRRCARRVLHDAIIPSAGQELPPPFNKSSYGWMVALLDLQHATSVLPTTIQNLSKGASYERGRVLRFHILALDRLTSVATDKGLMPEFRFPEVLMQLVSSRPAVYASTMAAFPDLRSLVIKKLVIELNRYAKASLVDRMDVDSSSLESDTCQIVLCNQSMKTDTMRHHSTQVPLSLLEACCVLLSIWFDEGQTTQDDSPVKILVNMLMCQEDGDSPNTESTMGLASAIRSSTGKNAIPVESWVMLARARSDFVAKSAALTAPTNFLPRLLMCSGLPRSSLVSMIDRVGKVGAQSENMDDTYNELLLPSASSKWDIGRLGKRREISRKLLGRLSAYDLMYNLSQSKEEDGVRTIFLRWLKASCKETVKPKKGRKKKEATIQQTFLLGLEDCDRILEKVTSVELFPSYDSSFLDGDTSDMAHFLINGGDTKSEEAESKNHRTMSSLMSLVRSENMDKLDGWLHRNSELQLVEHRKCTQNASTNLPLTNLQIGIALLHHFANLERKTEIIGAMVVKWVPTLSISSGSPELWRLLFSKGQKPTFLWDNLFSRCSQIWSQEHIRACRDWILAQEDTSCFDYQKVINLFIIAISGENIHTENFGMVGGLQDEKTWEYAQDRVRSVVRISLDGMLQCSDKMLRQACSRNEEPQAMILLLLVARFGRKQVQVISQTLIGRLNNLTGSDRNVLLLALLRTYAFVPDHINLGVSMLRSALTEAVEEFSSQWLFWRSKMDDALEDLISCIGNGSSPRVVQALTENAKKHPLLILRKLDYFQSLLKRDAVVRKISEESESRGVVFGRNLTNPSVAKIDGQSLTVSIRHWGYNYTDNIWVSSLEVILAVHHEVLFGCGLKMGLHQFLNVYLCLMSVQTQLRTSDRLARLKAKLSDFFVAYKTANRRGWDVWMKQEVSGLKSLGSVRNVLLSCDLISHQEAIDSVKSSSIVAPEGDVKS